jgi:hypothetical protein
MKTKIISFLLLAIFQSLKLFAQVQVSQEPFHRVVFQNKYVRILDVLLQPKDTTQFHIHSLPSLFVYFTNSRVSSQIKGKEWVKSQAVPGQVRYTSYVEDTLIHRVTNLDAVPFHVNDLEILSTYSPGENGNKTLGFPVLFENVKSVAYQLSNRDVNVSTKASHGPLILELIEGEKLFVHFGPGSQPKVLEPGKFEYIEPNEPFTLFHEGNY